MPEPKEWCIFTTAGGTAEQGIKEGKYALNWTRLSCKHFIANQMRLWLFVLAYNLGNFLRRLALPAKIKRWFLRCLLVKLIKIGAKLVEHGRYLPFQMTGFLSAERSFPRFYRGLNSSDAARHSPSGRLIRKFIER